MVSLLLTAEPSSLLVFDWFITGATWAGVLKHAPFFPGSVPIKGMVWSSERGPELTDSGC